MSLAEFADVLLSKEVPAASSSNSSFTRRDSFLCCFDLMIRDLRALRDTDVVDDDEDECEADNEMLLASICFLKRE